MPKVPAKTKEKKPLTQAQIRSQRKRDRQKRVEQFLALQMTSPEIQTKVSEEFDVSKRVVRNDINDVYARWELEAQEEEKRPLRRHKMRRTMTTIMQKAMADKSWNVALAACDRLCRLDGLFEPTQHKVGVSGNIDVGKMTSHDKRTELQKLLEMYSKPTNGRAVPN